MVRFSAVLLFLALLHTAASSQSKPVAAKKTTTKKPVSTDSRTLPLTEPFRIAAFKAAKAIARRNHDGFMGATPEADSQRAEARRSIDEADTLAKTKAEVLAVTLLEEYNTNVEFLIVSYALKEASTQRGDAENEESKKKREEFSAKMKVCAEEAEKTFRSGIIIVQSRCIDPESIDQWMNKAEN